MTCKIVENEYSHGGAQTELHIDGKFLSGWSQFDIPEEIKGRLEYMLDRAYEAGKRDAMKSLREFIGVE